MKKSYPEYGIYARPGTPNKIQYIADCIILSVKSGRIFPNQKLLSQIELGKRIGVDPKTIGRSYELLQKAGWIDIKEKKGCFVVNHPPSLPSHHLPLFAENGLINPTIFGTEEIDNLKGYANFATIGSESVNPASLFSGKQSPILKAINETTSISAKKWEEHIMEDQDWADGCRYDLEIKRGMQVDSSGFAVGKGRDNIRLLIAKLLITPGAGVILSCYAERAVINTLRHAQANLIFLTPGPKGLKPNEVRDACRAAHGTNMQVELLYTNPQRECNCPIDEAIPAMTLLMDIVKELKLTVLEENDGDIPKEMALPPLSLIAAQPVNNIVNINAFSTLDPGLQDIRLIAGPASFIQALDLSLFLNGDLHSIIDKQIALSLARQSTIHNFALEYEQQLIQWKNSLVEVAETHLADRYDIQLPVGGTGFWLKSKKGKEYPIDLCSMRDLGVPVTHSRQEIGKFCTATAARIGIGWGNIKLLKKCLIT